MQIASPGMFAVAAGVIVLTCLFARVRGISLNQFSKVIIIAGLMLLALAAADLRWRKSADGAVTVMVDLSPSTRSATYRDRPALEQRIHDLLGNTRFHPIAFAEKPADLPTGLALNDLAATITVFTPPPEADAILLFSDGRFELPATGPPTYPVIDPALDSPGDASVVRLEMRNQQCVATIYNDGKARKAVWSGAAPLDQGSVTGRQVRTAVPLAETETTVTLDPGDRWPENDSLSVRPAPPPQMEKWWIGERDAGAGWRRLSPAELPTNAAAYINPAVIVLDNIPADALSSVQMDRLAQYVRDLGGGLIVLGGDKAFAAGAYHRTVLELLSPMSSSPPTSAMHWMILVDASGSMAAETGAGTRWQIETAAAAKMLAALPPNDLVSIGGFSDALNWWSRGQSVRETTHMQLPPPGTFPRGPTALAAALKDATAATDGAMPLQLVVMTDAEAELPDPEGLLQLLHAKHACLNVLATGAGNALAILRSLAGATGGKVVQQADPTQWVSASQSLLRSAMPDDIEHQTVNMHFEHEMVSSGGQQVDLWNRTWLKPQATQLAETADAPMAAKWQIGAGHVGAAAFSPDIATAQRLADLVAAPPRDPRFKVIWQMGPRLHITVEAISGKDYLNDQDIRLEFNSTSPATTQTAATPIPQTAPGRYEIDLPAPRQETVATVRAADTILDRFAVAGRYAPEFDAIGNDRENLQALANRTGGAVIAPGPVKPIEWHWPQREIPLSPWLAAAGAAAIAAGAMQWKRSGN